MKRLLFPLLLLGMHSLFADFAFDFSKEIKSNSENWVFSPFSIRACLSMAALGANGETADEMKQVLGLSEEIVSEFEKTIPSLKHSPTFETDFQLKVAQGIWIHENFFPLPSYSLALEKSFQAEASRVPFAPCTASHINDWVAEETNQKIQDLIPPGSLSYDTRLLLVNALYFYGSWKHPFPEYATANREFHLSSGNSVFPPFMSQTGSFPYFESENFQALILPFAHSNTSEAQPACLLVLPKENNEAFEAEDFSEILSSSIVSRVKILVPKFTIEQGLDLNQSLKNLGISKAFTNRADFSKINDHGDLYLSAIFHKSFFSFEEKGVEAAAATAAVISATTAFPPHPAKTHSFIADRPFYFILFDQKTSTILFFGQVQNPES